MRPPDLGPYDPHHRAGLFPHPIVAREVRLDGFLVPCDPAALQRRIDRDLNAACDHALHFRVVSHLALVYCADLPKVSHTDPAWKSRGTLPEKESAVWILVAQVRQRGPATVVERIGWYVPYMLVDSGQALVAGRELFGFPKELGWTHLGDEHTPWTAEVEAVPHYHQDAELVRRELFRVTPTDQPIAAKPHNSCEKAEALHARDARIEHFANA